MSKRYARELGVATLFGAVALVLEEMDFVASVEVEQILESVGYLRICFEVEHRVRLGRRRFPQKLSADASQVVDPLVLASGWPRGSLGVSVGVPPASLSRLALGAPHGPVPFRLRTLTCPRCLGGTGCASMLTGGGSSS